MLTANQLRLLTALKTALAVIIAMGIAMKLNWEKPYWTGITVFIIFLPYVGAAFEKSMLRIAGTLFAGVTAYLLTGWFEQDQFMMSLSLFLILGVLGYGAQGNTYPYFFVLGGITLCIIVGTTIVSPNELWHLVLYRTLEVILGVVVALSVNSLIFPQKASNALRHKVSSVLGDCRGLAELACKHYLDEAPLQENLSDQERAISAKFPLLMPLFQSAQRDCSQLVHHAHAMEEIIREMRQCFVAAQTALCAAQAETERRFFREMETETRAHVEALLADMKQLGEDLCANQAARRLQRSHDTREALRRKVITLRADGVSYTYEINDVTNFYALLGNLDSLQDAMIRLAQADRTLYVATEASALPKRVTEHSRQWRLDQARVRHGIKVGLASIIALYAYLWLDWPSGVTAFLTCAIVMQVSTSASNQKSMLRLGGCLLGGLFGFFTLGFLEPHFVTYYGYMVPLFFIFAFFSWINNGPQTYSYAGFQAQIAFLLMTSISNQQSVDLQAGIDRFMGILLGVFIAALVHRLIWPVLPEREFRREMAKLFRRASDFMREQDQRITRQQAEPAARAQEKDLAAIEYLPAKTITWLGQITFQKRELKQKDLLTESYLHAQAIVFGLRGMSQANARELDPATLDKLRPELNALDHALANALQRCAEAFEQNKHLPVDDHIRNAANQLEARLSKLLREEKATRTLNYQQLSAFLALVRRYRELSSQVRITDQHVSELNFAVLERSEFF